MFRFVHDAVIKNLIPCLPSASTVLGFIGVTDIGKLCVASTDKFQLIVDTGANISRAAGIVGIIAAVPAATTPGSTVPFYVRPICPGELIEGDYSTTYENSTSFLLASSNKGKFFTIGATTTPTAGGYIDPSLAGDAAGTTDSLFFRMMDYSTSRGTVVGYINSSHMAI